MFFSKLDKIWFYESTLHAFSTGGKTASRFWPKSFACGGLFPFESAKTIQNNSIFVFVSFYWHFFCTEIPFLIDHCRANESISFIISTIIFFSSEKSIFRTIWSLQPNATSISIVIHWNSAHFDLMFILTVFCILIESIHFVWVC